MFINIIFTLSIKMNVILSVVSKVLDIAVQCPVRLVTTPPVQSKGFT